MSGSEPISSGLVVIARDAFGQIVTRITSHRNLVGAMHTAHCVLRLKPDAACAEVHSAESSSPGYQGLPLVAISRDELSMEQIR
jgi:hypothetical protein